MNRQPVSSKRWAQGYIDGRRQIPSMARTEASDLLAMTLGDRSQPRSPRPAPLLPAYPEPPRGRELRWVPVADLHLPISSGCISAILDLLAADSLSLSGPVPLRVMSDAEDVMHVGYYVEVAP